MNIINKNILEKELFYDGVLVLKYHIEYPSIRLNVPEANIMKFNTYNKGIALELRNRAENELYKEAIQTYKYNKEHGYPTMVYEVYSNFEITYNTRKIVSLYIDEYVFIGGAHGSTVRTSQTWNLYQNCMMPLESFFPNNPYFMLDILKEINRQILDNKEIYFEDACNLVLETFNPDSFYLVPEGIVIYFQQYDIAPYSSGIRTFLIKY